MDRKTNLEHFLIYYRDFAKKYPDFYMSRDYFYEQLRRYGIPNYDDSISYEGFFRYWKERYGNKPNINVREDKQQPEFLQFSNSHNKSNHIKMYLSIPSDMLQVTANIIFDYLANNNIGHQSKIANKDCSDVLILRLEDVNDVPKVLNFINNKQTLKRISRPINPFIMNNGILGITFDGSLSYNMTVALVLEKYFNERKSTNSLDYVSLEDFKNYVSSFYNDTFVNKSKISEFIGRKDIQDELSDFKKFSPNDNLLQEKMLINYMYVVSNISIALNTNDYNKLLDNYFKYNNDINNPDLIYEFSSLEHDSRNNKPLH